MFCVSQKKKQTTKLKFDIEIFALPLFLAQSIKVLRVQERKRGGERSVLALPTNFNAEMFGQVFL